MGYQDQTTEQTTAQVNAKRVADNIVAAQSLALAGDLSAAQAMVANPYSGVTAATLAPDVLAAEQYRRENYDDSFKFFKQLVIPAIAIWGGGYLAAGALAGGAAAGGGAAAAEGGAIAAGGAAAAEGAIVAAESGAIAAGAEVGMGIMPAAVVDTAAIAQMGTSTIASTLTSWAVAGAQKIAQSVASSYVLQALMPKPPPRPAAQPLTFTTTAPRMALSGGTTMFEDGFPSMVDWSKLGDLGMQLIVNQLNPTPSLPSPAVTAVGFPALPALGGMAARLLPGMAAAGAAAVGVLRSIGGRIVGWMLPSGQKVTRSAAVALAKSVGLSAAAGALGATVVDLAEAVMQEEGRKHRRRGISAADLSRTTRTMARVERMHRRIAKAARSHTR